MLLKGIGSSSSTLDLHDNSLAGRGKNTSFAHYLVCSLLRTPLGETMASLSIRVVLKVLIPLVFFWHQPSRKGAVFVLALRWGGGLDFLLGLCWLGEGCGHSFFSLWCLAKVEKSLFKIFVFLLGCPFLVLWLGRVGFDFFFFFWYLLVFLRCRLLQFQTWNVWGEKKV